MKVIKGADGHFVLMCFVYFAAEDEMTRWTPPSKDVKHVYDLNDWMGNYTITKSLKPVNNTIFMCCDCKTASSENTLISVSSVTVRR